MQIQQIIQEKYPELSEKEKKIATFLLQNINGSSNFNISKLAKETQTSPATITRFAKKIGCDSFVDLKIRLNADMTSSINTKFTAPKKLSNNENKIFDYYLKVIQKTEEITDMDEMEKVAQLMKEAPRIFIFGIGSSGLTAAEFTQRCLRMGLNTIYSSDPHMMVINSSIVKKGDLVIGISASGETREVNEALYLAHRNKAKTISITCFPKSTITKYADLHISAYSSIFIDDQNFINSQFSIMYKIDLISTILLKDKNLNKKMQRTISAVLQNEPL